MALNLGLRKEVYDAFNVINKIRNEFSHSISKKKISEEDVDKLYKKVSKLKYSPIRPDNMKFTAHGIEYSATSRGTPSRIKIAILYFCLAMAVLDKEYYEAESGSDDNDSANTETKDIKITLYR